MEPEAHRLDREALLADRLRVAQRVQREVDEVAAAAAEKRRSYLEWFVDHMRIEAQGEIERERRWADMRVALQPAAPPNARRRRRQSAAQGRRTSRWSRLRSPGPSASAPSPNVPPVTP